MRRYLTALSGEPEIKPQRDITKKLADIKAEIAICTSPLQRLKLLQKQYNLENGKDETEQIIDLAAAEREFAKIAKSYSERAGLVKEVWLAAGVPEDVLSNAGI